MRLQNTIWLNDVNGTQKLLESGVKPTPTDLLLAVKNGNLAMTQLLIDKGVDVNAKTDDAYFGNTYPLVVAAYIGNIDIAKALLTAGANVDCKNHFGETPLVWAALRGSDEFQHLLIDHGADIHYQTPEKLNLFAYASLGGNADFAVYLYEKGIDPTVPEKQVEITARANHILGDYFLSLDQYDKAKACYAKAQKYYDETVNVCKRGPVVTGRELLITSLQLATIALSAYQAHVETFQSHQLAQIAAMRHAEQMHTGIRGYSTYLARYHQDYIPTYSTTVLFTPLPEPPGDASWDQRTAFMKRKVIQFQKLSALMTRVLACFDSGKTGAELHSCVVDAGMEADAGEKSAQGIIPSTGSASGLGRAADVGQIALSFSPPPGKAFVYVIRPERLFRKDETFGANLDSEPFGTLNNGFYLFAALAPGEHSLEGYYQLHSFLGGNQIVGPPLKFTAESGKNYYFKIKLPGLIGGPAVEQTSETDGKALVQPGKLSPDNSFGH